MRPDVTTADTTILLRMLRDAEIRTAREITKRKPNTAVLDVEQAIYDAVTAELDARQVAWVTA